MSDNDPRSILHRTQRIVVKVGSSILTQNGELREPMFGEIARQVATLRRDGREVVLVSSGAIAIGSRELGWDHPGHSIPEKQAAAAVGQIGLIELYRRRFADYDITIGQVLVTRSGLEDRERFLNARHTLTQLIGLGAVPIVNENDTVATEEIRFGDNDNLSATVVNLVAADLLVIFTDVEGLYIHQPEAGQPSPPLFDVVDEITPEVERAAQGAVSTFGRGGMKTKLEAATAATASGASTVLCNGLERDALLRVVGGEPLGTLFTPAEGNRVLASRKHWLAFTRKTRGTLQLDLGATQAITRDGRSLLPAGIVSVDGSFQVGDPVACTDPNGREVARGLVAYESEAVGRIAGRATRDIGQVLGYSNGDEIIHRDDLVTLETHDSTPASDQRLDTDH
ncbi:glutamate 5-kinase [Myxococcota bacterium]|nr:glutamate 5-kinase [Myxococcota bacterium]